MTKTVWKQESDGKENKKAHKKKSKSTCSINSRDQQWVISDASEVYDFFSAAPVKAYGVKSGKAPTILLGWAEIQYWKKKR